MIHAWLVDGTHRLQRDPRRSEPLPDLPDGPVTLPGIPAPGDDVIDMEGRTWRVERVQWIANTAEPRILVA